MSHRLGLGRSVGAIEPSHTLPGYSRARVLAAAPVLIVQGRKVSRSVERLPSATGRTGVTTSIDATRARHQDLATGTTSPTDDHVVVLGDSVADGVGVDHHRNSLAGRLACRMAERHARPVGWHVIAKSGADAADVLAMARTPENAAAISSAEVIVVSVGVNDVKNLRSDKAWAHDVDALLGRLDELAPGTPVLWLGVPPMEAFPAMPTLLGHVLGQRSRRLDAIGSTLARSYPRVVHVPLAGSDIMDPRDPAVFASDGFHPSAKMHRELAAHLDEIVQDVERRDDDAPEQRRATA